MPVCNVLDFETEGINRRPDYPPIPVGFSLMLPGEKRSTYYAWGHPTENNCTKAQAQRVLRNAWRNGYPILCQHGKFDLDVAETHLGMPALSWDKAHDTEYLLFLRDPYSKTLSLKPAAEHYLKMPPEERDLVKEWVFANCPEAKGKTAQWKDWGRYICRAPGGLVGNYANGDVIRTKKLFEHLLPYVDEMGMMAAYDRERRLMPILLETERQGIRCDLPKLEHDFKMYTKALEFADNWLRKKLHKKDLNLDSDEEVAEALASNGIVTEWTYTAKTKQRSTAKKYMTLDKFHDRKIALVWGYRTRLQTCLSTFFLPWLAMARESGGLIYTNWNQVRQDHGAEKFVGARTGRLSSSPNLQNIPTDFLDKADDYEHPAFLSELPPLPFMRLYLLPDSGDYWIKRDISQQELRILAHFEDGDLLSKYRADPEFDLHDDVKLGILRIGGLDLPRSTVKIVNFQDIYGGGIPALVGKIRCTVQEARRIKNFKRQLMPDYQRLDAAIKLRGQSGGFVRTWGGRIYYTEAPRYVEAYKRFTSFEYKLMNYIVQGSAADCTKEAIIRYYNHPKRQARFLLSVHDELNSSAPKARYKEELEIMREAIESIEFDLTMLSEGFWGKNWCQIKDYTDPISLQVRNDAWKSWSQEAN